MIDRLALDKKVFTIYAIFSLTERSEQSGRFLLNFLLYQFCQETYEVRIKDYRV